MRDEGSARGRGSQRPELAVTEPGTGFLGSGAPVGLVDGEALRIGIVGQGALGTLFGATLAQRGHRVTVVSSRASQPAPVELRATGRLSATGEVTLAGEGPEEPWQLALVTTRAAQAIERGELAAKHLAPDGLLVPVQNGLVSLDMAEALGRDRVVPMVVGFNAGMADQRTVEVTSPGGVTLGLFQDGQAPLAEALAEALDPVLPAKLTGNPRGAVWSKWTISCAINGLAVVAGRGVGPLAKEPLGRRALISLVTEGVRLAEAEGVDLERVAGPLSPDTMAGSATGLGGWFRGLIVRAIGRRYQGVEPSSLDALRAGRDAEIAELSGRAVRLADEHGLAVPWNRALLDVVEGIEHGKREPGWASLEALADQAEPP